ncbi:lipopolysaccharide transport periplasmic protein LptA [Pseudohalioglobus sediminis]|uniref:Lipopolysaccharide export system protein LptA n=2 Tax=Pseudohalioglobus sediminis TaxID=2606449 RepID=A0A5B0X0I6_9GAMM|nr:lipopolysaccharide transport periplasmic protein LptA [Pseudohalioglobus sediminis]
MWRVPMCSSLDRFIACAVICLAMLAPGVSNALPDDREQPIHIEADEALRDEKQGFTRYQGNVQMDQGSLRIEADQITIYHTGEEADRVLATGKPARMQQQPDPEKGLLKARADTITYVKSEQRVELRSNAHIEQDGSIVTGDYIDYFIEQELVKAGSAGGENASRVQVVIPAEVLQDEEADRGTTDSK